MGDQKEYQGGMARIERTLASSFPSRLAAKDVEDVDMVAAPQCFGPVWYLGRKDGRGLQRWQCGLDLGPG